MSAYDVQLINDIGATIHGSQHSSASAPLWLQLGRDEGVDVDCLSVLEEDDDEPTSLRNEAHAILSVRYPVIKLEARRPNVKVQPQGIDIQSASPWQVLDLEVSSNARRCFTYVRPDDQVTVAGSTFTIQTTPKPRSRLEAAASEQVQVNSSIPGLEEHAINGPTIDFQDRLGFGRFNAPPLVPRSRTPTQASNGPTVEETPANHQRHVDPKNRPQRQRSSQLCDLLHRNHVPAQALISSPHERRSPMIFEDEESQDVLNFSTTTTYMQPPQSNGQLKPEPSHPPDAPITYEDLDGDARNDIADKEQPENGLVNGELDNDQTDRMIQPVVAPTSGKPETKGTANDVVMSDHRGEIGRTESAAEQPKRFVGTLADAGDDEQTESEDEAQTVVPPAPQSSETVAPLAKQASLINEGNDLPEADRAPPAKRGRKRKAISEGKTREAKKRRSNSKKGPEKDTPARNVSVIVKSAKKKAKGTPSPPSSANSIRKSPRQPSANADSHFGEDQFKGNRLAFSNSSVLDVISVKKFFTQKSLKQVDKPTNTSYDALVVGRGEVKKTSKLLKTLLLRKPIATDAWLVQSQKAGSLLDPATFKPEDLDAAIPRDKLLSGKHIIITVPLKNDYGRGYSEVAELAKLAGAENVISKPKRDCKSKPEDTIVLGLEKEDLEARNFFEHGFTCFTKDMLSSSILRGELDLDADEFKIKMSPSQAKKARGRGKVKER